MPRVFRFVDYGGPENQEFVDLPRPVPGPGEVLVKVVSAGVNPVDYKVRQGRFKAMGTRELPSEFGSEVSGIVEALGDDVDGIGIGDEVFGPVAPGHGAFSEYAVTRAASTARKPAEVSFDAAATLAVAAATAFDGVADLALAPGETLLITGVGGGVGVAAAQIARDRGLSVFGTASESKRALVESLGVTLIPYGAGVEDRLRQLLPGGADGILDLVGGDGLRSVAFVLKPTGALVTTADPATASEFGGRLVTRDHTARTLDAVAGLVGMGRLDPQIRDVVPFDDAPRALASVETGHCAGKVVIRVSGDYVG